MKIYILLFAVISLALFGCETPPNEKTHLNLPDDHWDQFLLDVELPSRTVYEAPQWEWKYFLGDDSGWVIDRLPEFNDYSTVTFPHRDYSPNTPFWYQHVLADDLPGDNWFYIDADDGGQVFVNEEQVKVERGFFYNIGELEQGDIITLRVLNDAGNGGVRDLRLFDSEEAVSLFNSIDSVYRELEDTYRYLQLIDPELSRDANDRNNIITAGKDNPDLTDLPWLRKLPWIHYQEDSRLLIAFEAGDAGSAEVVLYDRNGGGSTHLKCKTADSDLYEVRIDRKKLEEKGSYSIVLDDRVYAGPFDLPAPTERGASRSFAFWADSQGGWTRFDSISRRISELEPEIHIGLGDFVPNGYIAYQWQQFFHFGREILGSLPGIFIQGNHDYDGYYDDGEALWVNRWFYGGEPRPVVKYDMDGIFMLGIDLNTQFPIGVLSDEELQSELESIFSSPGWQEANFRVLLVHQPAIGERDRVYGGEPSARDVLRLASGYQPIDLVVSGHHHRYERGEVVLEDGLSFVQLIFGGAGRVRERPPLEELHTMDTVVFKHHFGYLTFENDRISGQVIGTDGSLIDEFEYVR